MSEIVILGVEEPQSARGGISRLEINACGEDPSSDLVSEQKNDLLLLDHTLDVELGLAIRTVRPQRCSITSITGWADIDVVNSYEDSEALHKPLFSQVGWIR